MSPHARTRLEMAVLALIAASVLVAPFAGTRLVIYNLTITALYST